MSVSKWAWTEECDGTWCVGECDLCDRAETGSCDLIVAEEGDRDEG